MIDCIRIEMDIEDERIQVYLVDDSKKYRYNKIVDITILESMDSSKVSKILGCIVTDLLKKGIGEVQYKQDHNDHVEPVEVDNDE